MMANKDELIKFDTDKSSWINDIDAKYKKDKKTNKTKTSNKNRQTFQNSANTFTLLPVFLIQI